MVEYDHTSWLATSRRRAGRFDRLLVFAQGVGIAALLLACADYAGAESFDRWFFSAEERRTLDDLRDSPTLPPPPPPPPGEKAAPVVDMISFDGKVERSDGRSTIWVNGRAVFTGNITAEGIRLESTRGTNGATRFVLPQSDSGSQSGAGGPPEFSLKPGQKVAVQNGLKFDAYEVRPGEDAESVLGDDEPGAREAQGEASKPPSGGAGDSEARAPSPGS